MSADQRHYSLDRFESAMRRHPTPLLKYPLRLVFCRATPELSEKFLQQPCTRAFQSLPLQIFKANLLVLREIPFVLENDKSCVPQDFGMGFLQVLRLLDAHFINGMVSPSFLIIA